MARIVASEPFRQSDQLQAFLGFVVQETLAGRGERLKGYTIGVEALGRDASFDPQSDPIVRVEAARLRRALLAYYDQEGAAETIEVRLDKGQYGVRFVARAPRETPRPPTVAAAGEAGPSTRITGDAIAAAAKPRASPAAWVATACIVLAAGVGAIFLPRTAPPPPRAATAPPITKPFEIERPRVHVRVMQADADLQETAATLAAHLSRFEILRVATSDHGTGSDGASPAQFMVELRLCRSCRPFEHRLMVTESATREVIYSGVVGRALSEAAVPLGTMAYLLGGPEGAVLTHLRRTVSLDSPFGCYLGVTSYFRHFDAGLRDELMRCVATYRLSGQFNRFMEQTVGFMLLDAWTQDGGRSDLIYGAMQAADKAVELGPNDAASHYLRSLVLARLGRLDEALRAGERAARANPHDAMVVAGLGARHLGLGDAVAALPLLERAAAEFYAPPGWLRFNHAVALFAAGRESDFLDAMELFDPENFSYGYFTKMIAFTRRGRTAEAAVILASFRQNHPKLAANARTALLGYYRNVDLSRRLAEAYEAAVAAIEPVHTATPAR